MSSLSFSSDLVRGVHVRFAQWAKKKRETARSLKGIQITEELQSILLFKTFFWLVEMAFGASTCQLYACK